MAVYKTDCDAAMKRIKEYEARRGSLPHAYTPSSPYTFTSDLSIVAHYFMQYPDPHDQAGFWQKQAAEASATADALIKQKQAMEASVNELETKVNSLTRKLQSETKGKNDVVKQLREANEANQSWCSSYGAVIDALAKHPDYPEVSQQAGNCPPRIIEVLVKRLLAGRENAEKNLAQKTEVIRNLTARVEELRGQGKTITAYTSADNCLAVLIQSIDRILLRQDDGAGVAVQPWENTRRKLIALVSENFQIRHQAEGAKMACGELKKRVADLESDLESLRPIAEKHPAAQLKHIGLREIATAVLHVYNGRLLETTLPASLPPEWQSPEWAGIHQAIQTTKSHCLPHSSIYVALDRLEKAIQAQFSRYKDQADRLTSESLSKDSKISDLQAKYLQARNNEEALKRQLESAPASYSSAWNMIHAVISEHPTYKHQTGNLTNAERVVGAIKMLISHSQQLDKVLGQRNALENELNRVKAMLAKRPGHWTRLLGIAHDIVRHVNRNSKNCIIKGSDSIKALERLFAEMEETATTAPEQPKGLLTKYIISKADGSPVDSNAIYFVLRLDNNGSDPQHALYCRYAARRYAEMTADTPHLSKLSQELMALTSRLAVPDSPRQSPGPQAGDGKAFKPEEFDPFDYPIFQYAVARDVKVGDGAITQEQAESILGFPVKQVPGEGVQASIETLSNGSRVMHLKKDSEMVAVQALPPATPYVRYADVKAFIDLAFAQTAEATKADRHFTTVDGMTQIQHHLGKTKGRLLAALDALLVNGKTNTGPQPLCLAKIMSAVAAEFNTAERVLEGKRSLMLEHVYHDDMNRLNGLRSSIMRTIERVSQNTLPPSPAPLLAAAKEVVKYLDTGSTWKVCHGSQLHHNLKEAVKQAERIKGNIKQAEKGEQPQSHVPVNAALLQAAGEIVDYFSRNDKGRVDAGSVFASRLESAVANARGLQADIKQADAAQQASLHKLYADMLKDTESKIRRDFGRTRNAITINSKALPSRAAEWGTANAYLNSVEHPVMANLQQMLEWADRQAKNSTSLS